MPPANLHEAFKRMARIGPFEAMRQDEIADGNMPLFPGSAPWFQAHAWKPKSLLSTKGREVRIVAITAVNPGSGSFSRMVDGILAAGLSPVVVEPLGQMTEILKRWKWARRVEGKGFQRQEQWRPTKQWIAERTGLV